MTFRERERERERKRELALGYLKNKVSQDLYKVNYHILLEKQVTSDI